MEEWINEQPCLIGLGTREIQERLMEPVGKCGQQSIVACLRAKGYYQARTSIDGVVARRWFKDDEVSFL